jgi:ectoine hydroxylase-related dioxygenase (phytanoyl-CoA dioxygenase family)
MKTQKEVIEEMHEGFQSLEDYCSSLKLSLRGNLKIIGLTIFALLYRIIFFPLIGLKRKKLIAKLDTLTNLPLKVKTKDFKGKADDCYLSEKEISDFEKTGLIGPFKVLDKKDAAALKSEIEAEYLNDFDGQCYLGEEIKNILKEHGGWDLTVAGYYQGLRLKNYRQLFRKKEISHRLASILDDEVICWRTQFFEKKPGSAATYWHQNSVFRENAKSDKLKPTKDVDYSITQLTAWVALSDVTIENGALRMMPGTFNDGRLEYMYSFVQDNKFFFMANVPWRKLFTTLKAIYFSSGNFVRAQATFSTVINLIPELFPSKKVLNLEMKAGECIIFTSMNIHGSFTNVTDDTRLAAVGRFTANHVITYPDTTVSAVMTPLGVKEFSLPEAPNFQVHGNDSHGLNKIFKD